MVIVFVLCVYAIVVNGIALELGATSPTIHAMSWEPFHFGQLLNLHVHIQFKH